MTGFIITAKVDNLNDAIDLYGSVLNTTCRNPGEAMLSFEIRDTTKIISTDGLKLVNGERNVGKSTLHPVQ